MTPSRRPHTTTKRTVLFLLLWSRACNYFMLYNMGCLLSVNNPNGTTTKSIAHEMFRMLAYADIGRCLADLTGYSATLVCLCTGGETDALILAYIRSATVFRIFFWGFFLCAEFSMRHACAAFLTVILTTSVWISGNVFTSITVSCEPSWILWIGYCIKTLWATAALVCALIDLHFRNRRDAQEGRNAQDGERDNNEVRVNDLVE